MALQINGCTCTGSSRINGDAFYCAPDNKLLLLADGASGAGKNGKVLMSGTCVETAREFPYDPSKQSARAYVNELFSEINRRLIALSQKEGQLTFGTIILGLLDAGTLTVTTFGDSPAYLYQAGNILRVARNQKRYEALIDQGFVTREQYEAFSGGLPPRMQGCFDYYLPEIVPNNVIEQYFLLPGGMLALCSDGLSDWVPPKELFAVLSEKGLEQGIAALLARARERALATDNYFDDITCVAACWD